MRHVQLVLIFWAVVGLAACGSSTARKEIEGNNTGGIVPAELARGANVQSLVSAHCAKWGANARITFSQIETGSDVVFVCEKAPITPAPPPPDAKPPVPAKKQTPRTT
jgi:hypothetical protein